MQVLVKVYLGLEGFDGIDGIERIDGIGGIGGIERIDGPGFKAKVYNVIKSSLVHTYLLSSKSSSTSEYLLEEAGCSSSS